MPRPEEWISVEDPSEGTEFGGVSGLVQPSPHEMNVSETINYMKSVPADEYVDGAWTSTYEVPPSQLIRP